MGLHQEFLVRVNPVSAKKRRKLATPSTRLIGRAWFPLGTIVLYLLL